MGNKLKEITYLTVKNLKNNDIILPSQYSDTFEKIAKSLNVDFTNEEIILKDLNQNTEYINQIVQKTNNSLSFLEKSTSNAQKAIQEKNHESLNSIHKELAEMKNQINSLQKQLFSDPLTEAYNRKWFSEQFLYEETFQNDGFIAFLDLNKFKGINDNYGHLVGDQVLRYLVKFLKKELILYEPNIVRYAGDEFIILFDEEKIKNKNIKEIIDKTQIKLSKQKLKSSKIKELQFSFSYGVTAFKKCEPLKKIFEKVDELMYKNKNINKQKVS